MKNKLTTERRSKSNNCNTNNNTNTGKGDSMSRNLKKFKLKKFKTSHRWWGLDIWGNGHTVATAPTLHGWHARKSPWREDVVIIGQSNTAVCATATLDGSGDVDIAFYDESPEELSSMIKSGQQPDTYYIQVRFVSGWGLEVLRRIQTQRAELAR